MNNIISLLALLVGLIAFFVDNAAAVTIFAIFFVIWGLVGLFAGGESGSRSVSTKVPKIEKE